MNFICTFSAQLWCLMLCAKEEKQFVTSEKNWMRVSCIIWVCLKRPGWFEYFFLILRLHTIRDPWPCWGCWTSQPSSRCCSGTQMWGPTTPCRPARCGNVEWTWNDVVVLRQNVRLRTLTRILPYFFWSGGRACFAFFFAFLRKFFLTFFFFFFNFLTFFLTFFSNFPNPAFSRNYSRFCAFFSIFLSGLFCFLVHFFWFGQFFALFFSIFLNIIWLLS